MDMLSFCHKEYLGSIPRWSPPHPQTQSSIFYFVLLVQKIVFLQWLKVDNTVYSFIIFIITSQLVYLHTTYCISMYIHILLYTMCWQNTAIINGGYVMWILWFLSYPSRTSKFDSQMIPFHPHMYSSIFCFRLTMTG